MIEDRDAVSLLLPGGERLSPGDGGVMLTPLNASGELGAIREECGGREAERAAGGDRRPQDGRAAGEDVGIVAVKD